MGDQLPAGARRWIGWPTRGAGTCSPPTSPRSWRRNSTIRTRCGSVTWIGFCRPAARSWPGHDGDLRVLAGYEFQQATWAAEALSPTRPAGRFAAPTGGCRAVELLGGPATHPFQPLYPDDVVRRDCDAGGWMRRCGSGVRRQVSGHRSADTAQGLKTCTPVRRRHFLVDGPTFQHVGRTLGGAPGGVGRGGVRARPPGHHRVWSPKKGIRPIPTIATSTPSITARIPGPSRVTSTLTTSDQKAPYRPAATAAVVARDAADFVRGGGRAAGSDRCSPRAPGSVVAAYDTGCSALVA